MKDAICVGEEAIIESGAIVVGDCMIRSEPAAMLFSIFQAGTVSGGAAEQCDASSLLQELRLSRCLSLHPAADVSQSGQAACASNLVQFAVVVFQVSCPTPAPGPSNRRGAGGRVFKVCQFVARAGDRQLSSNTTARTDRLAHRVFTTEGEEEGKEEEEEGSHRRPKPRRSSTPNI